MLRQGYITLPVEADPHLKEEYSGGDALSQFAFRPESSSKRRRLVYTAVGLVLVGGCFLIPFAASPSTAIPDAISDAWSYGQQRISDFWSSDQEQAVEVLPLQTSSEDYYDSSNATYSTSDPNPVQLFPVVSEASSSVSDDITSDPAAPDEQFELVDDGTSTAGGSDTPEEMKEEELEILLPVSELDMPSLPEDRPLMSAAEIDAQYCPDSSCKFLFPSKIFEQESKAQIHLYALALVAHSLDRILVLPNVRGSRMGARYPNSFSFYYEVDSLRRLGFKTILQSGASSA
jgi:hypothetical protein